MAQCNNKHMDEFTKKLKDFFGQLKSELKFHGREIEWESGINFENLNNYADVLITNVKTNKKIYHNLEFLMGEDMEENNDWDSIMKYIIYKETNKIGRGNP